MRKMNSTENHDSNFGNLCIKRGGSFQKEMFSFFSIPPPVRTPLVSCYCFNIQQCFTCLLFAKNVETYLSLKVLFQIMATLACYHSRKRAFLKCAKILENVSSFYHEGNWINWTCIAMSTVISACIWTKYLTKSPQKSKTKF